MLESKPHIWEALETLSHKVTPFVPLLVASGLICQVLSLMLQIAQLNSPQINSIPISKLQIHTKPN